MISNSEPTLMAFLLTFTQKRSNIYLKILNLIFSNAIFLLQDSNYLTYDREIPNGDFLMRERTAHNLPSKPTIYSLNVFTLSN
jgi:hypothetical protein